jgi:ankyrin repeat protein
MLEEMPKSILVPSDDFGDDWSWLDLGLGANHEDAAQSLSQSPFQSTIALEDSMKLQAVDPTSINLINETDALSPFKDIQMLRSNNLDAFEFGLQEKQPVDISTNSHPLDTSSTSLPRKQDTGVRTVKERSVNLAQRTTIDEWILPDFGMQPTRSEFSLFDLPTMPRTVESISPTFETPGFLVEDYDLKQADPKSSASGPESTLALCDQLMVDNVFAGERPDNESRLPIGGRPSRASIPSITSLNRRLSSKCSQSCLEDIVSLMDRHTICGSSAASSSARTSHISSKKSSMACLRQSVIERSLSLVKEPPLLPVKVKPPNVLPGIFHIYCAAQLDQNKLRLCHHDGLPCEHTSPGIRQFFTSHIASKVVVYNRVKSMGINEIDSYGNSILHVAASFCAPISYIIKLIKQKADINATNAAGETFMHLLYAPYDEDDVCSLLEILSIERFNFGQVDQHGQTCLHLITRPWLPQQYLVKVIRKIQSLGFVLPTSRDNLGFTILRQMNHLGTQALGFDPGQEMAFRLSLGLTCETQGYIIRPHSPAPLVTSTLNGNECLHHYEKQNFVHNLDDLRRYEDHADLLRTIINAGDKPWFEDSKGRNGLHCLAEVAFDLPLPDKPATQPRSPQDDEATNRNARRECYLDGLLAAGVNPNNCDKKGNTPLMSFIIHTRAGEDDGATTRTLTMLCAGYVDTAKADIHRRNRRGETALHLAVKLGRLAATKFLLRKGANVHARNKRGSGVLKAGTEACKKATQDEALYARIMLCMSLAMSAGAVSSPTIIQEWSLELASQPTKI